MKLYCTDKRLPDAWVELPEEWLSGDYEVYLAGYSEALRNGHSFPTARLAGVLTLALKERIAFDVPGVVFDEAGLPDLSAIRAEVMGFLIGSVARSLEATQEVPFGLRPPSPNGTAEPPEEPPQETS